MEEVEESRVVFSISDLTLHIYNPNGETVNVYDIMGRHLTTVTSISSTFRLPTSGIYLIEADGHPARRIVAVK